jgi:hypothetical protein
MNNQTQSHNNTKTTWTRRTFLQSAAGIAIAPYLITEALARPKQAIAIPTITPTSWHRIPTIDKDDTGFIIGNLSGRTIDIPVVDVTPQVFGSMNAVFLLTATGCETSTDVTATLGQTGTINAVVLDANGCALQGLKDVQAALDQQFTGLDLEDFRLVCTSGGGTSSTISIGTATTCGNDAPNTALETAIALAGFGRSNSLCQVWGVFLAIAANTQTLRINSTRAIHRSLRAQVSPDAFTTQGLVVDDRLMDGEFRVSLIVPV